MAEEVSNVAQSTEGEEDLGEEKFLKDLYQFMSQRDTPIERIPHLGFKQIDLFLMYKAVKEFGGYHQVSSQQLWKKVYNVLGGNPRSTSAATCTRRHYEKLLLPFEYHLTGYGDDITITVPQPHKRLHHNSFGDNDSEYPRNAKRQDFSKLCFSLGPSILPHSSTNASQHQSNDYMPALYPFPQIPTVTNHRKSLERLRNLAKEYNSSSGWEEPLNLSQKGDHVDTISCTPSSFSPPNCNKTPKFLNPPLCQSWDLPKDDGLETSLGDSIPVLPCGSTQTAVYPQITKKSPVNDLTSREPASSIDLPSFISLHGCKIPQPKVLPVKPAGSNQLAWKIEGTMGTSQSGVLPLNLSHTASQSHVEPVSRKELQIPLWLFQDWIKACQVPWLVSKQSASSPFQLSEDMTLSPEIRIPTQSASRSLGEKPIDLSQVNNHTQRRNDMADQGKIPNQSQLTSLYHHNNIKPPIADDDLKMPYSLNAFNLPCLPCPSKGQGSDNPLCLKTTNTQEQNDKKSEMGIPRQERLSSTSPTQNLHKAASKSPPVRMMPHIPLELLGRHTVPPEMTMKVNTSPPLMLQLSPEEYVKLKKLISISP
uniref:ARID domain-containing protein n=1 Tax=Denticeps clupeoides TaxID=299321 RepID=A0AAY4ETC4_9TELE